MNNRMLQSALTGLGEQGPGSASSHMKYGGSRKFNQRCEYSADSKAGFVELCPKHVWTVEMLKSELSNAPGITKVEWQTSKSDQGNASSGHWAETNLLVYSSLCGPGSASSPLEFEVTRNSHMKDKGVPLQCRLC